MRFDEAYSGKVFIASRPEWEEADAILYGMPMDWTVSYRPGSRFGPSRIFCWAQGGSRGDSWLSIPSACRKEWRPPLPTRDGSR